MCVFTCICRCEHGVNVQGPEALSGFLCYSSNYSFEMGPFTEPLTSKPSVLGLQECSITPNFLLGCLGSGPYAWTAKALIH